VTIKKIVDVDIELDSKEIANAICDMWSDEQAQMLLEISKIVDTHSWQACSQLYEVGRWVYESTTKEERKKVTEFIDMLREYITDFESKGE
jgi:hypothetical protein